jgi:subtilase family serine protease
VRRRLRRAPGVPVGRLVVAGLAVAGLAGAGLAGAGPAGSSPAGGTPVAGSSRLSGVPAPRPLARAAAGRAFARPPTTAECENQMGIACYSPAQLQTAYGLTPLYAEHRRGRGSTIVIVDSFGSPQIRSDLATFDRGFHLPAPPRLQIIHPAGAPPRYQPGNPTMVSWAQETSLDVEYAHAMAPAANLLLVETPVAETEGATGFPQIVKAETYVVDHRLGDVISQSFGATEETFPTAGSLLRLRGAYQAAARAGVSVLAASGDEGASGLKSDGQSYYDKKVVEWPASDPLVTAVGGTALHLTASGAASRPATVWNETAAYGEPSASGGGVSEYFGRPTYQNGVQGVVHDRRGIPDVSLSAAVNGGAIVYLGPDAAGAGYAAGYQVFGGTSEATPLFAGIVAIADQVARLTKGLGHDLGALDPLLYRMAAAHDTGLVDVTSGTNTVSFYVGGEQRTVTGYRAVAGDDLASGLGTIYAARFVPQLVATARQVAGG